ncbi:hypothetical protein V6W75_01620, partial [Mannheimia sp. HC-2023]|uniref:hypothetical protein n=1 Tax=Mannheimia indoligenes TaxID=3103145 RepID=UPI002FE5832E
KIKRRTGIKLNLFTTVRRCVGCIIEIFKTVASPFFKVFYQLDYFSSKTLTSLKHQSQIVD